MMPSGGSLSPQMRSAISEYEHARARAREVEERAKGVINTLGQVADAAETQSAPPLKPAPDGPFTELQARAAAVGISDPGPLVEFAGQLIGHLREGAEHVVRGESEKIERLVEPLLRLLRGLPLSPDQMRDVQLLLGEAIIRETTRRLETELHLSPRTALIVLRAVIQSLGAALAKPEYMKASEPYYLMR